MKAHLLSIGDELLIGQVVNTNASWLGEQLTALGVEVTRIVSIGDDEAVIRQALADACAEADLAILSGGLGPTHDDLTREAVAAHFGVALHEDAATVESLLARFARRGRSMPERNRKQARVPEGFEILPNPIGTAPGLWREADGCMIALVPGVPRELQCLFLDEIAPRLRRRAGLRAIVQRTLLTAGIGESNLQDELGDLTPWLNSGLRLAYLPSAGIVRLRLTAIGNDRSEAEARLSAFEAYLRNQVPKHIFGEGDDRLEAAVGRLLAARGYTLAVAESCTGGHVLNSLTDVPGSSTYVLGGIVAYSNAAKIGHLGVDSATLEADGAVSEMTARQMARGVRTALGADIGLATTGIAGPSGGTPDKPVGTVWIGYADAEGDFARHFVFTTDRDLNKSLSTTFALDLVRRKLMRDSG